MKYDKTLLPTLLIKLVHFRFKFANSIISIHESFSTFFGRYLGTTFFWKLSNLKSTPKNIFKTIGFNSELVSRYFKFGTQNMLVI